MVSRGLGQWVFIASCAIFLLTGSNVIAQQTEKVSPKGTKFLLYLPSGYTSSETYPMLIVLHGQGGLGDNLNLLVNKDQIPSRLIHENRWPSSYRFIVVTPQLKRDESVPVAADQKWPPEMVDEVVEYVRKGYAVNPNKIYITGLSQGSHGSYDYTAAFPSKIAAAVYISGAPDSTIACQVKNVPVWVFHGTDDSLVPPVLARGLVRNINACSPSGKFRPRLTMLPGKRHEGWNEIYNNTSGFNIYNWMLKFTKNSETNTPPHVSAGNDMTIRQRVGPIQLHGDIFDSDGSVSSIQWTKVSGPAVTLADTGTPYLKLTDAAVGAYEFEVTATDDDGGQATDRVKISIVSKNSAGLAITGLNLLNANNKDAHIADLYDGYVVNPKTQTRFVNISASVSGSAGSVVYRINGDQNARTTNTAPYKLAGPRWTVEGGEYLVCATPFSGPDGTGNAGISQCFKIVVSTTATPPPPPEEEPPVEEPPVEEPPVEEPPEEEPPVEEPPVEEPPVEEPPVEEPPVEEPPVEEPPVEEPPVEEPPVEEPPVEEPPVEEPPVEEPPVEEPPVEEPPVEEPPVEEPPVEEPPVEEPPVEEPPVEEPPVEEPPVEEPPVEEPPVEEPPVEEPPVEEPPVEGPPVEEPPKEDPVTGIRECIQCELQFYPNPATETVYMQLGAATTGALYYAIINNSGLKVAEGNWQIDVLTTGVEIDVSNFAPGLYFLTLRSSGWNYQHKFMVRGR